MPWIKVIIYAENDEDSLDLGVYGEENIVERPMMIRSEIIEDVQEIEKGRLSVSLYGGNSIMIKEDFETFYEKIKDLDYQNKIAFVNAAEISNKENEK